MTSKPNSQTIWNAVLTVIGIALIGTLGYLFNDNADLREQMIKVQSTRFSKQDGMELRVDITDVLTEVDKRESLLENDFHWLKEWVLATHKLDEGNAMPLPAFNDVGSSVPNFNIPAPNAPPSPRRKYDVRQQRQPDK